MSKSSATRVTAIVAIVAVLAVIVGATLLQVFSGGSDTSPDTPAETADAGPAPADAPAPAPGECNEPPALPASPPSFGEVPDKGLADDATWRATVATNCGDIVMELFGDKAPQTVSSFLFLAEEGYWKDSPCHRLVPQGIFVLQCGDPTGTGTGDPGYGYGIENAPASGVYPRGTLAMARTADPNTNGGQFFIVFQETQLPVEGGGYSIFGKVVEGMDIVDRIVAAGIGGAVGPEAPAQPISILDVTTSRST
jgi:peptidyl-prolyl cis-trans isomerase B (cyclophilin B)